MSKSNSILDRVLSEVKNASISEGRTTGHSSYVSGVFEDNSVLNRVLSEVKNASKTEGRTTGHSSYVSGVFEE